MHINTFDNVTLNPCRGCSRTSAHVRQPVRRVAGYSRGNRVRLRAQVRRAVDIETGREYAMKIVDKAFITRCGNRA